MVATRNSDSGISLEPSLVESGFFGETSVNREGCKDGLQRVLADASKEASKEVAGGVAILFEKFSQKMSSNVTKELLDE